MCYTEPFLFEHLILRPSQGITEFQITRLSCILAYTLYTGTFSSSSWRPNFWYMCLIFSYTLHTGFQGLAKLFGYLSFFSIFVLNTALIDEHLSFRHSLVIIYVQITFLSSILAYRLYTGPWISSSWRPKFLYMCLILPCTVHTGLQGLAI